MPDAVALVGNLLSDERAFWSFRDLPEDALRVANCLTKRFNKAAPIGIWAPNSPDWVIFQYGAALATATSGHVEPWIARFGT